jgi:hypothetical protein
MCRVHGVVRTFNSETDKVKGIRRISAPDFACFQMEMEDDQIAMDINDEAGDYHPLLVTFFFLFIFVIINEFVSLLIIFYARKPILLLFFY